MIKQIFTWWNSQTLGTFLYTIFFGKFVGKMNLEINIIKIKKIIVGLFITDEINASKSHLIGFLDTSHN